MIIVFAAWFLFAWLFRKRFTAAGPRNPSQSLVLHQKLTRYAVMFVPVFAFTLTVGAFDWLISD